MIENRTDNMKDSDVSKSVEGDKVIATIRLCVSAEQLDFYAKCSFRTLVENYWPGIADMLDKHCTALIDDMRALHKATTDAEGDEE